MRTTTSFILSFALVACSSPDAAPIDAGSNSDSAVDSGSPTDAGRDSSVPADSSVADASDDASVDTDASMEDAGLADADVDAGPAPSLEAATADLVGSTCDFEDLCEEGVFDRAACETEANADLANSVVALDLLDPRRVTAAAACIRAIDVCDMTSGNGAPQVIIDCLETVNMGDATWYNCLGREEECGGMAMTFTDDDLCLFFSMMTDAARAQGQTCISMSTCEAGANCMEEFIFD